MDRGIDEPEDYSKDSIEKIVEEINDDTAAVVKEKPNIVMVQLESFFDVNYLKGLEYATNPVPVFERLKKCSSTGFLTVPSMGAGTANTEFEVLSGMSLDYFGMGEYPYKTVLQNEACETICTDLRGQGYSTHAIHNNAGTFYDRNIVFANMGFDTFTSIEYMQNVEYNPIGWAKDDCLTGEIMNALASTDNKDFVFTITVQGHGKYQRGADCSPEGIAVKGIEDESERAAFEYYLSQLSQTDDFIGDLVASLSQLDEPVVLVLYGDHLPNFDIESEELENQNVFQTEYVVWSNFQMEKQDEDISSYQLAALTLERAGVDGGIFFDFHNSCADDAERDDKLGCLEYDALYGEKYAYGTKEYTPSQMRMGVNPVIVNRVKWRDGTLFIHGENFTEWSVISADGDALKTEFLSSNVLLAYVGEPETGTCICVEQQAGDLTVLSVSNEYEY